MSNEDFRLVMHHAAECEKLFTGPITRCVLGLESLTYQLSVPWKF